MWKKTLHFALLICGLAISALTLAAEGNYEVAFYSSGFLNDKDVGIDRDVIAEIQKRTGLPFRFSEKPRARIWHELKSGSLAMTVSGIQTAERDQFAWFIPYMTQRNMAILLKTKAGHYRSLDEFVADKTALVGVVRGFVHGEKFDEALSILRKQDRVYEASSIEGIFHLLRLENRIDLLFALPVFYQKQLTELKMQDKVQINDWDPNGEPIKHCLVLSRKLVAESDVERMRKALSDMKADGTLNTILTKYLPEAEASAALRF